MCIHHVLLVLTLLAIATTTATVTTTQHPVKPRATNKHTSFWCKQNFFSARFSHSVTGSHLILSPHPPVNNCYGRQSWTGNKRRRNPVRFCCVCVCSIFRIRLYVLSKFVYLPGHSVKSRLCWSLPGTLYLDGKWIITLILYLHEENWCASCVYCGSK